MGKGSHSGGINLEISAGPLAIPLIVEEFSHKAMRWSTDSKEMFDSFHGRSSFDSQRSGSLLEA